MMLLIGEYLPMKKGILSYKGKIMSSLKVSESTLTCI